MKKLKIGYLFIFLIIVSCESFVEVPPPNNRLVGAQVFASEETALSAMQGIYNQLFVAAFSNGYTSSITFLAGLSADNIETLTTTNLTRQEFQQNELNTDNQYNLDIWTSAYAIIYNANAFLKGLSESNSISAEVAGQLEGEARFVRAFTYFYLVNLYGEVPLILSTNYRENQLASRDPVTSIYEQITTDLLLSIDLLGNEYRDGERTRANRYAAQALLARVYLFQEDWELAEAFSTRVIANNSSYEIVDNLNEVFMANSREAILQISPLGDGDVTTHTNDGELFIIDPFFSFFATARLAPEFVATFRELDKRRDNWIGYSEDREAYFPFKYKIDYSTEIPPPEYSMVLRLAEQYLIRAEAKCYQGDLTGAIQDINVIRERAGLEAIAPEEEGNSREILLDLVLSEKRKELFAEWGHRWLDLKRTGRAGENLGTNSNQWQQTDVLYPIPEEERIKNANLTQNPGY